MFTALVRPPKRDFIALVELDLSFSLYRAVSAAKVALSTCDAVEFQFAYGNVDIRSTIARSDFECWIGEDLARLEVTVDQVLSTSKITPKLRSAVSLPS